MEKSEAGSVLDVLWLVVTGLSYAMKNGKWLLYEMLLAGERGQRSRRGSHLSKPTYSLW